MNPTLEAYLHAMRLDRWPRSISILTGTAAAWVLLGPPAESQMGTRIRIIGLALLATFAVALFNYIINEITDAPFDRHHPLKKHRPVPSGRIPAGKLFAIGLGLLIAGFIMGWFVSRMTMLNLGLFALAGVIYNVPPIRAKDHPYVDALVESANNPLRFNIGWYAFNPGVHPPWTILLAWWAFGAFLMYAKRLSEKRYLTPEQAALYRRSLATYSQRGLSLTILLAALISLASIATFALQWHYPRLWLSFVLLIPYCAWIFNETLNRSGRVEEPEALFRRPAFVLLTLLLIISLIWGIGSST